MTSTEKILRDLIALPSVNPAFLPVGDPLAGEGRIAEFLVGLAAREGIQAEFKKVLPQRPNLLLRLTPAGKVRHRVLLAPHLDTVNATADQFVPRRSKGRLYGRGSCDTKGSIAAMVGSLCDVARTGRRPSATEIVFVGLVDEENAQYGSRALAASRH